MRHWLASYYPVTVHDEIIGVGNVVIDITERTEAEEFRSVVVENMAEGLYALDADGLVTHLNPAGSRMLGWTEAELVGRPMHDVVHFQRADGTPVRRDDCPILQVLNQGRNVRIIEEAFTRKDGSIFPVAYSSAPLRSGSAIQGPSWCSGTSPRRARNGPASAASSRRSAGSAGSATPSTSSGSSSTPNPSCRWSRADAARSCCCA
jgi:PAS domain S-box-containing protein